MYFSVDLQSLTVAVVTPPLVSPGARYLAHAHLVKSVPLVDGSTCLLTFTENRKQLGLAKNAAE